MENENLELQEQTPQEAMSQEDFNSLVTYALAQRYRTNIDIQKPYVGYVGKKFKKEQIFRWLATPWQNEKRIRAVSNYLFESSGQYKRLCNYQADMVLFSYIISPVEQYKNVDVDKYINAYDYTSRIVDGMNIRAEGSKLLRRVIREGVVYAYALTVDETQSFCVLDPDYCRMVSTDPFGCIKFEFDFSYFDLIPTSERRDTTLAAFGKEFVDDYEAYHNGRAGSWQLIGENGICVKYQDDILRYSIPPYISVFDSLFDIDDYKHLTKAREESGNYNLLGFEIPTTKDGKILMDSGVARKFIDAATEELPSNIGVLLSPMKMEKYNFAKTSSVADRNAVTDAEEQFWNATGISNLLFGGGKSSANALTKSIIADEIDIFPIAHQIERWINRRLRLNRKHKFKFKVKFLDVTAFNQSDMFDLLYKAGTVGMPVKNAMAAVIGQSPADTLAMARLENDVLQMRDTIYSQPLKSTNTMSSDDDGGRPEKNEDDLSESGEKTRENEGNVRE